MLFRPQFDTSTATLSRYNPNHRYVVGSRVGLPPRKDNNILYIQYVVVSIRSPPQAPVISLPKNPKYWCFLPMNEPLTTPSSTPLGRRRLATLLRQAGEARHVGRWFP